MTVYPTFIPAAIKNVRFLHSHYLFRFSFLFFFTAWPPISSLSSLLLDIKKQFHDRSASGSLLVCLRDATSRVSEKSRQNERSQNITMPPATDPHLRINHSFGSERTQSVASKESEANWNDRDKKKRPSSLSEYNIVHRLYDRDFILCYNVPNYTREQYSGFSDCTATLCSKKRPQRIRILCFTAITINLTIVSGGDQNMERRNIERPIFRNFEIANIKITKDWIILFLNSMFHFLDIIRTPKIFNNFSSCEILIFKMLELFFSFSKLLNFIKLLIIAN